jgi:hypothetical protein
MSEPSAATYRITAIEHWSSGLVITTWHAIYARKAAVASKKAQKFGDLIPCTQGQSDNVSQHSAYKIGQIVIRSISSSEISSCWRS